MAPAKRNPKGLDDRQRDQDGTIRQKRGDTLVGTLRKEYGNDFAFGYRSDTKLDTLLKRERVDSLWKLIKCDVCVNIRRPPKTGSYTTEKSTESIKANAEKFSKALESLSK